MAIISGEDIRSILENTDKNAVDYEAAADKYLGVTDEGYFPEDIIEALESIKNAAVTEKADTVEVFGAGFIAALTIIDRINARTNGAIE